MTDPHASIAPEVRERLRAAFRALRATLDVAESRLSRPGASARHTQEDLDALGRALHQAAAEIAPVPATELSEPEPLNPAEAARALQDAAIALTRRLEDSERAVGEAGDPAGLNDEADRALEAAAAVWRAVSSESSRRVFRIHVPQDSDRD